MDFAARRDYRFGEIDDETVEQAVKCECAEPLGESRRPLHVDEQEHARFNSRPVIAAGDEIEQHVLPEQPTHVVHEGEYERGREREQHVLAPNAVFDWRRERPRPEGEAEQDHHEIDDRLGRHVHRKGRPLKRRPDRPRQNEGFERDQNARNHRAGQQTARNAVERKQRTAFAHRNATAVNDADRRAERSEPENEPERVLQMGKRHRGRALGCWPPQSTRHLPPRRRFRRPAGEKGAMGEALAVATAAI